MTPQAGSVGSLLSALLLSDYRVLKLAWNEPFVCPLDWERFREPVYFAYQPWGARRPDHVFNTAWQGLKAKEPSHQPVLLPLLRALVGEFLECRHGGIHVRPSVFGAWQQSLISRMSSLPLQAMADVEFKTGVYTGAQGCRVMSPPNRKDRAHWQRKLLPLPHPLETVVDDYVEREGLHETHLHLNGSTHAEICWLRALRDPRKETKLFDAEWQRGKNRTRINDLVGQVNPDLTPLELFRHLRVASRLRLWLCAAAEGQIAQDSELPVSCEALFDSENDKWSRGLSYQVPSWREEWDVASELEWQARLMERLLQTPSAQLTRMFHAYLLLQNEYYRLLVQGETQYGFDQFQKFTLTGLRDPAEEEDYLQRFHAMHGVQPSVSTVGYLEGRFAPKDSLIKTYVLLQAILGGYLGYLREASSGQPAYKPRRPLSELLTDLADFFYDPPVRHRNIHRLTLVAHFVKGSWSHLPQHKAGPYRHYALDQKLRRQTGVLLTALRRWPRLATWVRGIDAAANELDAPPDVFAPIFRVCQRAGLTHRSFHAGEDFRHLLTGLSYLWDTLTLLDLRNSDRIGHGTAMGIRPTLWLQGMPGSLKLHRGEWMLGVLAAWQLLRDIPEMQMNLHKLQRELEDTACEVFGEWLPAARVERAMARRGLCRRTLQKLYSSTPDDLVAPLNDFWRKEVEDAREAFEQHREDVDLLWKWLSDPDVQQRAEMLIDKDTEFLDAPAYLRLQQALMRHVADRGVLIETLPSSNVRISQYQNFSQHHALRWMRVPGHLIEGDPEIMVCLGSDDPGIFAGDLETEFHQLYAALRGAGLGDSEALERLKLLNERGRTYRFHDKSLS